MKNNPSTKVVLTKATKMVPEAGGAEASLKSLLHTVATGPTADRWAREEIYGDDGR